MEANFSCNRWLPRRDTPPPVNMRYRRILRPTFRYFGKRYSLRIWLLRKANRKSDAVCRMMINCQLSEASNTRSITGNFLINGILIDDANRNKKYEIVCCFLYAIDTLCKIRLRCMMTCASKLIKICSVKFYVKRTGCRTAFFRLSLPSRTFIAYT